MLTFHCSRCGQLLRVGAEFAGRPARCQRCGSVTHVPRPLAEAAAPRNQGQPPAAGDADRATVPPPTGASPDNGTAPSAAAAGPGGALPEDVLAPPQGPGEIGRLGPYRVSRVLGVGGMGVVFEAVDVQLHRAVALKALLPVLAASPNSRERFLREARAAAAIDHDHVVTIYQVGEDRGLPYLAMQLLRGESLETRLRRDGRLPPAEALRVGREVAEGLAAAHERGLIHRDVKPANIWLQAGSGRVKLLDFGLARAMADDSHFTQSGAVLGTPAYMAPEQVRGRAVDGRADLFGLGCVLYRCLTGRLPFAGADTLAILSALATETPRPMHELNSEVPPALADLVMRLLAKDPNRRPSSARAVAEALAPREQPTPRPAPVLTVEPLDPPASADDTLLGPPRAGPLEAARPRRPRPGARLTILLTGLVALGGLLALCLAGAGWWALRGALPGKSEHPDRWIVLFRSDDPSLWDTDTRRGELVAVPLRRAPELIHYVRLRRLDTGEALVLPITAAQLDNAPAPIPERGSWWNGTAKEEYNGRHLGIAQAPRYKWPNHDGLISVMDDGWDAFTGSGFGHMCEHAEKGQQYCWRGKPIPRTVFEIAVTAEPLTDEEQRCLVPAR
jgi:serine/threonine protein kinase